MRAVSAAAIGRRLLAQQARVNVSALRRRDLDVHDWRKLIPAAEHLATLPLWIDDTTSMLAGIRRLVRGQEYRLVIVDCRGKWGPGRWVTRPTTRVRSPSPQPAKVQ